MNLPRQHSQTRDPRRPAAWQRVLTRLAAVRRPGATVPVAPTVPAAVHTPAPPTCEPPAAPVAIDLDAIYAAPDDVVIHELAGELFIVPVGTGVDQPGALVLDLNETGRAIWARLDGVRTLRMVAAELAAEYAAPVEAIEADVADLAGQLVRQGALRAKNSTQ